MKTQIQTVETNGFSMDCFRFGHGAKTLVVLPGLSVESVMKYAAAVSEAYRLLTDDYTVFVFDRRKEIPETYSVYDMARDTAAALAGPGSVLDSVTPHKWIRFSANTSELTVRGGTMETIMGAWFRKWLESEGLIPENCRPADGEIRFYANSLQRTNDSRVFTILCGHDSNLASVLTSLGCKPDSEIYDSLPELYGETLENAA